ncbi:hypothetical protein CspeluHIS016_0208120 [Cutaneotrichosporon spelunceum]|uniref:Protein kinase domain-containing protein n=1 Tax=Cutaneotrichosporon spelunceum TaxID=1672016 RepID=A0AAD3TSP1_9TREE|nr:hypothetical protein CspeluHIS016_0208120 [Cutaneotrichosporon spelunceum]
MTTGRLLESGVQGDVYVVRRDTLVVVKVVHAPKDGDDPQLRPHNAAREAKLLASLRHPNIVTLLEYTYDGTHRLTLEALPLRLSRVAQHMADEGAFILVAHALFSALKFLHARGIAHRDIKPDNILLSTDGVPKLIDFSTAWIEGGGGDDGQGNMVCQIGTGPYRAPELLFGPHAYDARAIDLWAAGATLAEFYVVCSPLRNDYQSTPLCGTFFNATFGDLGLAGSIFDVLGTPTAETWPSFTSLPDAAKVRFDPRPPRGIRKELCAPDTPASVLEAVLRLDPAQRASAETVFSIVERHGEEYEWHGMVSIREHAMRKRQGLECFLETGEEFRSIDLWG